jgi:hypothetical protein
MANNPCSHCGGSGVEPKQYRHIPMEGHACCITLCGINTAITPLRLIGQEAEDCPKCVAEVAARKKRLEICGGNIYSKSGLWVATRYFLRPDLIFDKSNDGGGREIWMVHVREGSFFVVPAELPYKPHELFDLPEGTRFITRADATAGEARRRQLFEGA